MGDIKTSGSKQARPGQARKKESCDLNPTGSLFKSAPCPGPKEPVCQRAPHSSICTRRALDFCRPSGGSECQSHKNLKIFR